MRSLCLLSVISFVATPMLIFGCDTHPDTQPKLTTSQMEWKTSKRNVDTDDPNYPLEVMEDGYKMIRAFSDEAKKVQGPGNYTGNKVEWGWKISFRNKSQITLLVNVFYRLKDKDGFDVVTDKCSEYVKAGKTATIQNTSYMDYDNAERVKSSIWSLTYEKRQIPNPSVQEDKILGKIEADPSGVGELLDKAIRAGKINEHDLKTQGNEKYLKALALYRKHQEESLSFPINSLEIRNANVIRHSPESGNYATLTGSIYNKSKSHTATDIVIRVYYYEKDVLVDTEEISLQANQFPISIGPNLAKAFDEVRLSHYDILERMGKLEFKIANAKRLVASK
jgi:hypothetical protein